jgi:hypothetical protein
MIFTMRAIFILFWLAVFLDNPLHAENNATLPKEITTNYSPEEVKELEIIRPDLNRDGRPDWVVIGYGSLDIPSGCGSQGCNYEAYLNMGDGNSCETYALDDSELRDAEDGKFDGEKHSCFKLGK